MLKIIHFEMSGIYYLKNIQKIFLNNAQKCKLNLFRTIKEDRRASSATNGNRERAKNTRDSHSYNNR